MHLVEAPSGCALDNIELALYWCLAGRIEQSSAIVENIDRNSPRYMLKRLRCLEHSLVGRRNQWYPRPARRFLEE